MIDRFQYLSGARVGGGDFRSETRQWYNGDKSSHVGYLIIIHDIPISSCKPIEPTIIIVRAALCRIAGATPFDQNRSAECTEMFNVTSPLVARPGVILGARSDGVMVEAIVIPRVQWGIPPSPFCKVVILAG
jgi:hypothetical protein